MPSPSHRGSSHGTGVPPVQAHGQDGHATIIRHGAYLPHWRCEGATYAFTFRLADSLPRKSFTAKQANRRIGATGPFWQPEPYDHLIRDEDDFQHQVEYVLTNPARAGLKTGSGWAAVRTGDIMAKMAMPRYAA